MPRFSREMLGCIFSLSIFATLFSAPLVAQTAAAQTGKELTLERVFPHMRPVQ